MNFKQVDQSTGREFDRDFLNLSPLASWQYKLAKQKNIRLNYNGNSTQPNLAQIQPIRVNDDPLNIMIGNPNLKQTFNNRFSMSYDSYKILTDQYLYGSVSYSFTSAAIVNSLVTDSAGKSTYQSVNLDNRYPSSFYLYSSMTRKVSQSGLSIGIQINTGGNTYYNFINSSLNSTRSYNLSTGFSVRQNVAKKYSFNLLVMPNYTMAQSSLQKQLNNNGWGLNMNTALSLNLPGKVEIRTDGNYEFKEKTQSFSQNFDRLIWNSTVTKKFNKAENLALSVSGNDLLNQNIGFSRTANSNFITQNSYTTIQRYFMISISYDFNKMGAGAIKK